MKRIISIFTVAMILLALSCDPVSSGTDSSGLSETDSSDSNGTDSSEKEITAFGFSALTNTELSNDIAGEIDGTSISVAVPEGTSVGSLVADFLITGVSASVDGVVQESGTTAIDFTNSVTYIITAEDGSSQDYTVTVNVPESSANAITSFGLSNTINTNLPESITADINDLEISFYIPYGIDVSSLIPEFTISGTGINVGGIPQTSGTTPVNFSNDVIYTVTAANGSTSVYTVTAKILPRLTSVTVEAGAFIMGDTWNHTEADTDETPTHQVTLTRDFFITATEITYAQYKEVHDWAEQNGYSLRTSGWAGAYDSGNMGLDNEPVTHVYWRDAVVWCNAASEYEGLTPVYTYNSSVIKDAGLANGSTIDNALCDFDADGYRLPTEAEWEYAARGGHNDTDPGVFAGDSVVSNVSWYNTYTTQVVGTKNANELGIYDMSGNVNEYCWDLYGDYSSASATDPTGATSGTERVYRGGSSMTGRFENCRVTHRTPTATNNQGSSYGFRIVRTK